MKKTTIYIISGLTIVLTISVLAYRLNNYYKSYNEEMVSRLIEKIDERVSYVDEKKNYNWYDDCYEDDKLIYRRAFYEKEMEYDDNGELIGDWYYDRTNDTYYGEDVLYSMYYDENEKLIYADIRHYRSINYSIYFDDDKLLYVILGDIADIDGMKEVKKFIKNDESYTYIITDIDNSLKYAYEGIK